MSYDRERAEDLNRDHHARMSADARASSAERAETILSLDRRSRDRLLWAMRGCEDRYRMRGAKAELLEIGAGRAGWRDAIVEQMKLDTYVGLEVVREVAIEAADKGVLALPLEEAPVEWNGRFEYIYSRHVMEHVLDVDLALRTVKRLLAPSGIIGAVTPHYFPDPEPAHVSHLDIGGWMNAYSRVGLKPVYAVVEDHNCVEAHIVCVHKEWLP